MAWGIVVHNASTPSDKLLMVTGEHGERRPVRFEDVRVAAEASRIVHELRRDSAFKGTGIVQID